MEEDMKPTLGEGLHRRLMALLLHLHGGVIHTLDSSALILWLFASPDTPLALRPLWV